MAPAEFSCFLRLHKQMQTACKIIEIDFRILNKDESHAGSFEKSKVVEEIRFGGESPESIHRIADDFLELMLSGLDQRDHPQELWSFFGRYSRYTLIWKPLNYLPRVILSPTGNGLTLIFDRVRLLIC